METKMPLYDKEALEATQAQRARWEHEELSVTSGKFPEAKDQFRTISGIPVQGVYSPEQNETLSYAQDLGNPGQFPFTRGVYPTMYRGKQWSRRQIAGFGTASSTNARFKFLMENGQTGLSTDFDHPTLTGYDSLHPLSEGEVGRLGVAIDTLPDMAELFEGIPLDKVSISLTVNHPAIVLLAFLLEHAKDQGVGWDRLRGTVQNDSLKESFGQKTFAVPPRGGFRLTMDLVEYCTKHVPAWNTISISGYHTREAGSDAIQELAFTLAQGMAYIEGGQRRGMAVDAFAPRLSFFFGVHMDFFEEIAKLRAARRLWARIVKERYGATDPRALLCRFHSQTLGSTLVRKGMLNNIVRGTTQALAAVLGGTQSLHVSGYDEAHDIPSEDAMRMSLTTQRILGAETGVASTADPLGGSFFMEKLTSEIEERAMEYINKIDSMGNGSMLDGMFAAIDSGYIEKEIADASYAYQRRIENKDYMVLGLNDPIPDATLPPKLYEHDDREEERQKERLVDVVSKRDPLITAGALDALREGTAGDANLMPLVLAAARSHATEGEIMGVFREVFGEHHDPAIF
jgi:methylmalonyl-CoA mutase N-terminal domain/subunit